MKVAIFLIGGLLIANIACYISFAKYGKSDAPQAIVAYGVLWSILGYLLWGTDIVDNVISSF